MKGTKKAQQLSVHYIIDSKLSEQSWESANALAGETGFPPAAHGTPQWSRYPPETDHVDIT